MARISSQTDLCVNFPFFCRFGTLYVLFAKVTCPVRVAKHMAVILGFLSFFRCKVCSKIPPGDWAKPLMSAQKKYVYSCHMGFGSECSLGGEWSVSLGGEPNH